MRAAVATGTLGVALLCGGPAHATAGFAERHSRLEYSDLASLHWIHPGDGCDAGKYCFRVVRSDGSAAGFRGLDCSLRQINAPAEKSRPFIMAECCGDGRWLVYDLRAEEYLAGPGSYDQALAIWLAHGLDKPHFAHAEHGARGLSRTWSSRLEDWAMLALLWLPALLLLSLPVGLAGCLFFLTRYWRQRKPRQLVWSLLFLLPSLPAWWLVARVVAAVVGHR